ncbi:hypothetical protein ACG7TL_009192 [Trametes sanguinea]
MLSLATVLALPVAVLLYFLWTFLLLLVRQAISPLRHMPGPPSTSLFMGNLKELHDQENNGLVARWASSYGRAFVYRGFMGGRRLMLADPVAVNYVMSRGYDYPKPDFVRDSLASMAAGYEGLLTAEGEMHRKQNQAFSAAQVKSLSPVFWRKANRLRDIWISIAGSPLAYSTPADPLMGLDVPNRPENRDPEDAAPNNRDSSAVTTSCLPNPFASFVPSKSSPTFPLQTGNASIASATSSSAACKIDVLPWLARATLDVIGEAGFGYEFHSLDGAAEHRENQSELAQAFGVIFSTARKFRVMTILQVWFPVLRHFVSAAYDTAMQDTGVDVSETIQRTENSAMRQAMATMRKIGMELIEQRREPVLAATEQLVADAEKADNIEGDRSGLGRDLLSVLSASSSSGPLLAHRLIIYDKVRSNVAEVPSQRMSINEILCQISTFLAAGHETSSSSLTWTLFALARNPAVQAKLRAELRSLDIPADVVPSSPLIEQIMQLPYLDAVVRESLRLYAPISTTMRVASVDDVIPISAPLVDRRGQTCEYIRVRRGDIISIPIQALNKSSEAWGADAEAFHPERWMRDSVSTDVDDILTRQGRRAMVQGLWGHMLTFGGGTPVNGNRSCIGYRFALSEIKIFLYVLVRDLGFSIDPNLEIEKKVK